MGAKALSAQALESAIQSATSLDELKALVAKNSTEKVMNADGTIRGLVFYREMVNVIAGHLEIAEGSELRLKMHGSADAFLAKYRLRLVKVRYQQVTRVLGEIKVR